MFFFQKLKMCQRTEQTKAFLSRMPPWEINFAPLESDSKIPKSFRLLLSLQLSWRCYGTSWLERLFFCFNRLAKQSSSAVTQAMLGACIPFLSPDLQQCVWESVHSSLLQSLWVCRHRVINFKILQSWHERLNLDGYWGLPSDSLVQLLLQETL